MSVYASGLNAILGITFDTFNNLYIANSGSNNIINVIFNCFLILLKIKRLLKRAREALFPYLEKNVNLI